MPSDPGELRARALSEALVAWAQTQSSEAIQWADAANLDRNERASVEEKMAQTQHQPLPMLILLRGMSNAMSRLWTGDKNRYKPLCLIMQFAPSLFPEGDFDRLSELDRQRLVTFLNWINDPFGFIQTPSGLHMFVQRNPKAPFWFVRSLHSLHSLHSSHWHVKCNQQQRGPMFWDHAVSSDLVHWHRAGIGLSPSPEGFDSGGCH